MPDAQNDDPVVLPAVAQDVGPDGRHLAFSVSGIATAMRELREAVGERDKPVAEPCRGGGVEG